MGNKDILVRADKIIKQWEPLIDKKEEKVETMEINKQFKNANEVRAWFRGNFSKENKEILDKGIFINQKVLEDLLLSEPQQAFDLEGKVYVLEARFVYNTAFQVRFPITIYSVNGDINNWPEEESQE